MGENRIGREGKRYWGEGKERKTDINREQGKDLEEIKKHRTG